MSEYYPHPAFKERILEYIPDSVYLVGFGKYLEKNHFQTFKSVRPTLLDWMLEKNLDGFTSVWQKNCYLIVLDLEYYNPKDYSEPFNQEESVFQRMEPFCSSVEKVLDQYGIEYIKLMTGQGYHYASKIKEGSPVFGLMDKFGKASEITHSRNPDVPCSHNRVHDASGKLMEFLYSKVNEIYEGHLQPKDIRLDNSMMVLDLDLWADPLFMRDVRLAFSSHQKHIMKKYIDRMGSDWCANNVPTGYSIPAEGLSLEERIKIRRNRKLVTELAKSSNVTIPYGDPGWLKMYEEYMGSKLFRIHGNWDKLNMRDFPSMDKGLVPDSIDHILEDSTKIRWSEIKIICDRAFREGIEPMSVARFFYDLFTEHFQWKLHWVEYDPEMRAKYWVRLFHGMSETLDDYRPLYN